MKWILLLLIILGISCNTKSGYKNIKLSDGVTISVKKYELPTKDKPYYLFITTDDDTVMMEYKGIYYYLKRVK